ncbi:MAG: hypothetical protein FWF20_12255 [Betaproteobacteria bacterium]|nr:hypothetical protein [Betaproteobacteria bacterium]
MAKKTLPETPVETQAAAPVAQAVPRAKGGSLYVYSTLANDQKYIDWQKGGADVHIPAHAVLVKGGSGVMNKRIVTPLGIATEISEEEAAFLERNPLFKMHAQKGFVRIERRKADPEKVAADMSRADPAGPKTPADYADKDGAKPNS